MVFSLPLKIDKKRKDHEQSGSFFAYEGRRNAAFPAKGSLSFTKRPGGEGESDQRKESTYWKLLII